MNFSTILCYKLRLIFYHTFKIVRYAVCVYFFSYSRSQRQRPPTKPSYQCPKWWRRQQDETGSNWPVRHRDGVTAIGWRPIALCCPSISWPPKMCYVQNKLGALHFVKRPHIFTWYSQAFCIPLWTMSRINSSKLGVSIHVLRVIASAYS